MKKRMSRREFLILAGAAGGSTILAACMYTCGPGGSAGGSRIGIRSARS
jgi:hypothetical protein